MNTRFKIVCTLLGLSLAPISFTWAEDNQDAKPAIDPQKVFAEFDKNKDGKIEPGEIPDDKKRFFERLLRLGDKNGDGILEKSEFANAAKEPEAPKGSDSLGGFDGPPRGFNPAEIFDRADKNKDGKITKDELPEKLRERLAPLFEKAGKDELTREDLARFANRAKAAGGAAAAGGGKILTAEMFKRIDKDGDGKITLQEVPEPGRKIAERIYQVLNKDPDEPLTEKEFLDAAQKLRGKLEGKPGDGLAGKRPGFPPPDGPEGRFRGGLFGKLDTDKDGQISKAEFSKLSGLFDELDVDKDGQLSPRELLPPPPGMGMEGGGRPTAATRPKKKPAE